MVHYLSGISLSSKVYVFNIYIWEFIFVRLVIIKSTTTYRWLYQTWLFAHFQTWLFLRLFRHFFYFIFWSKAEIEPFLPTILSRNGFDGGRLRLGHHGFLNQSCIQLLILLMIFIPWTRFWWNHKTIGPSLLVKRIFNILKVTSSKHEIIITFANAWSTPSWSAINHGFF